MTIPAGPLGIGELAGKCDQPFMGVVLLYRLVIAIVTRDAIGRGECMCRTETILLSCMALQASARRWLRDFRTKNSPPQQRENSEQTENERWSTWHTPGMVTSVVPFAEFERETPYFWPIG